jgi:hypothetical protein
MGEDGAGEFNSASGDDITADGRTFSGGIGVRPFDKIGGSFGSIMKGLELSFGTTIQKPWTASSGFDAVNIRTSQTRSERVSLIRSSTSSTPGNVNGMTGASYYFTPGVGWTWDWISLNLAGHFKQSAACIEGTGDTTFGIDSKTGIIDSGVAGTQLAKSSTGGSGSCADSGGILRTAGWQFIGSFWLWSPKKGLLAGNPRDGGFMISPMFGRVDAWGSPGSKLLANCSGSKAKTCTSASAIQAGIGMWYYVPGRFMNVGVIWDHWACTNCNSDINSVVKGGVAGQHYDFDTITLISRFQF